MNEQLLGELIILSSIGLRIAGLGYSLWLLYRVEDVRFGFLTLMLGLMASRQIMTYQAGTSGFDEVPGLVVSVLAVLTVYYLAQYTEQETQIKETIQAKNDRLRTFQKAIEHAGHAIFITDPDGTITYANQAVESVTGFTRGEVLGQDPSLFKSGYHDDAFYADLWKTISSGSIWDGQIVNERKDGETCWVDMTIAPIVDEDGAVEKYVAVDTDITERKERKQQITEQKDRLAVLNRTNEVIRDINRELVQAGTREDIETAVIEQFARSDQYAFAWISAQSITNDSVRPRTWAGIDDATLESMVQAINDSPETDPLTQAGETGQVQITSCTDPEADWCSPWRERDYQMVGAIPLTYGETSYGVLCIGTEESEAFEDIETAVFQELGDTIAYAINAVESKEALLTDSVTEVEFRTADSECFSVGLTAELGGEMELQWVTPGAEDALVEYFTIRDIEPADVVSFAEDCQALGDVRVVTEDDSSALFRFEVVDSCVAKLLGDYGGDLRSIRAAAGESRITAYLSRKADVRTILEALQTQHEDIELTARREVERPTVTTQEIRTAIEESLTDRQQEALQTAFIGGFFEWPRGSSGEDIAEIMGINQSTFLQHLRAAERKLLDVLLDGEQTVPAARVAD